MFFLFSFEGVSATSKAVSQSVRLQKPRKLSLQSSEVTTDSGRSRARASSELPSLYRFRTGEKPVAWCSLFSCECFFFFLFFFFLSFFCSFHLSVLFSFCLSLYLSVFLHCFYFSFFFFSKNWIRRHLSVKLMFGLS